MYVYMFRFYELWYEHWWKYHDTLLLFGVTRHINQTSHILGNVQGFMHIQVQL